MNTMTMEITVWTPEDRATREQMIYWCANAGIRLVEERINERRFLFSFEQTPFTNPSKWSLLEAKLNFEWELRHPK